MIGRQTPWTAAVAVALGLVLACTHEQRVETEETAEAAVEETGEAAGAVARETQDVADRAEDAIDDEATVELSPRGASGVSGNADLRESGASWRVEIELNGLAEGVAYGAALHRGSCAAAGPRVAPLGPPTAAEGGSTSTIPLNALDPGDEYSIRITGEGGDTVACGELPEISAQIG